MKLIKINTDHFVVVDDSGRMTHSTNVFDEHNLDLQQVSLSEVKELIGEVDVEKKMISPYPINTQNDVDWCNGYQRGYNQALEDNKEKKYTEEDLRKAYMYGDNYHKYTVGNAQKYTFESLIQHLQSKTEWDVEFVDGKLKLL